MRSTAPPRVTTGSRQLSLLRLNGPGAPAIQAIAAINPGIARRLVSWTPSYAHALSIVLQAGRASAPEEAKRLFARETRLQQAGTVDLLREAGFGEAKHLVPLLDRLGRRLYPLDDYRGWARLLAAGRSPASSGRGAGS